MRVRSQIITKTITPPTARRIHTFKHNFVIINCVMLLLLNLHIKIVLPSATIEKLFHVKHPLLSANSTRYTYTKFFFFTLNQ